MLLLVGRDNWQKDELLNQALLERLDRKQLEIVWEDPAAELIYSLRKFERKLPWLPTFLRRINLRLFQLLYALMHPTYFQYLYCRKNQSIPSRCNNLKKTIKTQGAGNNTVILSRSSGGRVSSLIADELNIKHIICLGYPFQHPAMGDEPERYVHLADIKTPMLILQGVRDEYGGIESKGRYPLSPSIELTFVDTNHDFNISARDVRMIVNRIEAIAAR